MADPTSLYPQAQPPLNPLAMAGQAVGLATAANQNKLFQQEFGARKAIGPLYQQAIDPTTGRLDTNLLLKLVASDPATAFKAGEIVQQATEREAAQVGIDRARFDLAREQLTTMNARMSALLLKPEGQLATKDVLSELTNLVKEELVKPADAANFIAQLPGDETGIRETLNRKLIENLDSQQRLAALYGTPEQVASGGATQVLSTSPLTGSRQLANVPTTLTPGEATEPVPAVDPATGLPTSITRSQFAAESGAPVSAGPSQPSFAPPPVLQPPVPVGPQNNLLAPSPVAPALPGAAARPAALTPPSPSNALMPPSGMAQPAVNDLGVSMPQPPLPPQRPAMGVQTGLPPGAAAAAEVTAKGGADALVGLRSEVATSPTRLFQLQKALDALRNTTTGPGTEGRNAVVSFLAAAPGIKQLVPEFAVESVKNFDEAKKYLEQYAQGAAQAMGPGSDAKLALALSANASTRISNLAAQDVVKANIGLERFKQAQLLAFEQSRQRPENFQAWAGQWATTVDPRAFIADLLPKSKAEAMIRGMTDRERDQFMSTRRWAIGQGLM